jgi:metallo-beta-lactamase class B
MRYLTRRRWLVVLLGVVGAVAAVLGVRWKSASDHGGQKPAEPFRIAGNLYYVGANDVTSFLLTGPEGHVLIDGGYPGTAPMIMESIAKLGFNIRDVKVLLNSHAHFDHAGGLAALQQASGAELWISDGDADIVASGGAGDPTTGPLRLLAVVGFAKYPVPRIDHRFTDGAKVRLGPIELTAHVTGGHMPGCTSCSIAIRDGDRELLAVDVSDLDVFSWTRLVEPESYPGMRADLERTFTTLRSLPADIFLNNHARPFGRYRKFQERATARNPVDPFIDRKGYLDFINQKQEYFRKALAEQQRPLAVLHINERVAGE